MRAVMIIPTGIGCEIGGHNGDATPVARLLASVCDKLILHPNVVNASDINEMPENSLYVEGSLLDRFLSGEFRLREVKKNKILVVVNSPLKPETINAVSSARATRGIEITDIVELKTPLIMKVELKYKGIATGSVTGWRELIRQVQVRDYDFTALAINTHVDCDDNIAKNYFENGGVNPWGGIEAFTSKLIAKKINKPVAHAPTETESMKTYSVIVDPRMSAEMISTTFLFCVLKGLHKSPQISQDPGDLGVNDIDCLISPINCVGPPHRYCMDRGIPVIAVKENKTVLNDKMPDEFIIVENYSEAVGVMVAIREGISLESIKRPLEYTRVNGSLNY